MELRSSEEIEENVTWKMCQFRDILVGLHLQQVGWGHINPEDKI